MFDKVWKAKWITEKSFYGLAPVNVFHKQLEKPVLPAHREDLKNRHMLVRRKFSIDTDSFKAYIDITADDYYKLYVNGHFIGQGPAPGYYFHYNYNRYDVSGYLAEGDNVIAVHVYYQGLINRVWNSGDYRQGMIAELFVNDELYLQTDAIWKYTKADEYTGSRTIGYETQFLEDIDSRLAHTGWRDKDYNDTGWKHALVNFSDDHKLVPQPTPSIDVCEMKPAEVKLIKEGHYLIDFGHEITGQFRMTAEGKSGDEIEIRCGEELAGDSELHVRYEMRCNCTYKETWTLSGGKDVLEFFDYKAFRYVEVIAPAGAAVSESFCAVVRHYPFDDENCRFETSSKLLNDIWSICKNGVKYGTQEVYTDCPSREKGQYLGDMTVTAHSHIYLSGDLRLFKKALMDFALSTFICPGMMAVAPGSFMQEIADYSLQWPQQLLNYYMHSCDIDFLREMHPVAEGILRYFERYERPDGLLENVKDKWNMVDWPVNLRDGYDFDLSTVPGDGCHNVVNAFYCGAVKTINTIRDILQVKYEDRFPGLKEAFINAFFKKETGLFADSTSSSHTALHSNIIALYFNLVPDEAVSSIVELIKRKRLSCGVYNAYFLLKGLAGVGEYDLVYDLITSQDERSWANMLREGATTCFEAWGKEQKWNTSLCHPWASAPVSVLIEDIAGLTPGKPGWDEVCFKPHIPKSLEYLNLEFRIPKGRVKLEWDNGKIDIHVPQGVILNN